MKIKKLYFSVALLYAFFSIMHHDFVFGNQVGVTSGATLEIETDTLFDDSPVQIQAPSAVLIDADTGIIIYGRNIHESRYPASVTKLMTALMLLEYIDGDFDERIFMSRNAVFSIPRNSSHIAMNEYETLSAEESLYAIMLESANEVSNAIAEHVGGDVDTFATMMTIRAHELGATNTNFMNAHGLHDDEHYTTAYDMALIMRELITHERFVEIIGTRMFRIPPTERQPLERVLNNTHRMIHQGNFFHEHLVGGKTGFTNEAAHTLVSYARNDDDIRLITVTLGNQRLMTFADTAILVDYGFTMFGDVEIFNSEDFEDSIRVVQEDYNGEYIELGYIPIVAENDVMKNMPINVELSSIETKLDVPSYLYAPVLENQIVGQLLIKYKDTVLDTVNLLAADNIYETLLLPAPTISDNTGESSNMPFPVTMIARTISIMLALFLIVNILRIRYRRRLKRQLFSRKKPTRGSGMRYAKTYRYKQQ